jgi:phenylacetic acid degradation protein
MALVYAFGDCVPVIDPTAYVHPTAVLIGDVVVAAEGYVGPHASLRGDFGRIILGRGANLQDNCVVHSHWALDCEMRESSHIGHGAVIHACTIGRDVLVGMNAVVMDNADVGDESIVAAMAFVRIGQKIAPRSLVAGIPARLIREVDDAMLAEKQRGTALYRELARRCQRELVPAEPLPRVEPDRPRYDWGSFKY